MKITKSPILAVQLVTWFALAVSSVHAAVSLVVEGTARADVVLARDATADEKSAAAELTHYIKQSTGADLHVQSERTSGRPAILVGLSAVPAAAQARVRKLEGEGFIVETAGETLMLAGNGEHGTSFAVYEFLQRFAGVRWLWPGDLGEVVPPAKSLAVDDVSLTKQPAFLWRNLGPGGELWGPKDRWEKERELGVTEEHQAIERQWELRNGFGGEHIFGGHSFGMILPPSVYGSTHPEYYALVNGKRDTWKHFDGKHSAQLCTTNPEVVQKVIEYCNRMFDEHPDLDGISIAPNDGRGFCECDQCTKLDSGRVQAEEGDDPEMGKAKQTRVITDRIVHFGNQVADGVSRNHPGKKVMLFGYGQFHEPPDHEQARPNLLVLYTVNSARFWNDAAHQIAVKDLTGWGKHVPTLGVYEYLTQMNFPDMPRLIPQAMQMELQDLQRLGSRYYQTQAGDGYAVNGLNFYVLGKLLWDPSADVAAIQADYITKAFGPAAPAMSRYYERLIASFRDKKSNTVAMNSATLGDYRGVLGAFPPELRAACGKDLDEAQQAATGAYRQRVDFVRAGVRYFELTMKATEATYPLVQAGWKFGKKGAEGPANADNQALEQALDHWRELDRCIDTHRNDFVLSYMWVKCNEQTRSFNPLWWVTEGKGGDPIR